MNLALYIMHVAINMSNPSIIDILVLTWEKLTDDLQSKSPKCLTTVQDEGRTPSSKMEKSKTQNEKLFKWEKSNMD